MRASLIAPTFLCCAAMVCWLSGCGSKIGSTVTNPPPPPPSFEFSGKVTSGPQPVIGAAVQIYVAGSSGYGMQATALGPSQVTDASGNFTVQGTVSCPSSSALTYLAASGGHVGTGSDNSAIALMAALGACGNLNGSTANTVDEVTTVAAVWALAPFLGSGGLMGTSSGNAQGLANAFANVSNLVDLSSGAAPGKAAPANAIIPTAKIDTLADILAACVEQTPSTACGTLFAAATPPGGSAPNNTLDAALDIARNPANNPAALFALASTSAPFQPVLGAAPPDWTLAVSYTGAGLNTPGAIALDAAGNVWVANYFSAVSEFSSSGQPLSPAAGYTGGGLEESYGLAVNKDGSLWVTNEASSGTVNGGAGALTVLNPTGQVTSGANGYVGGGVFFPVAAAADTDGSVWIADYGDSTASKFAMSGTAVSGSTGFGSTQLQGPVAVAIDAGHNAWFANQAAQTGSVTSISADGGQVNTFPCGGDAPSGIALDAIANSASGAIGHIWTANYYSDSVSELALQSNGSATLVGTVSTGGGIRHPNGIAVDGAGNVWVANYRGNSISAMQGAKAAQPGTPLSPAAGYGADASLVEPFAVAIDASGNLWVSSQGANSAKQFTITQFLGVATPVKTPLLGPPQLP